MEVTEDDDNTISSQSFSEILFNIVENVVNQVTDALLDEEDLRSTVEHLLNEVTIDFVMLEPVQLHEVEEQVIKTLLTELIDICDQNLSTSPQTEELNDTDANKSNLHFGDDEYPCPTCGGKSVFMKFNRIKRHRRARKGVKCEYIWRYGCTVKTCKTFFGDYFRFTQNMILLNCDEDGEFLDSSAEAASPVDSRRESDEKLEEPPMKKAKTDRDVSPLVLPLEPVDSPLKHKTVKRNHKKNEIFKTDVSSQTESADLERVAILSVSVEDKITSLGSNGASIVLARRLMLCQNLLRERDLEVKKLREKCQQLTLVTGNVAKSSQQLRDVAISEGKRVRDDVDFMRKEFQFYHQELINEARMFSDKLEKEKTRIHNKLDIIEKENTRSKTLLELRTKETKMARDMYDSLERERMVDRRTIIISQRDKEDMEKKMKDGLWVSQNQKCAHCRTMQKTCNVLTDEIVELKSTMHINQKVTNKCQKKLAQSEGRLKTFEEDNKRLDFEQRCYKKLSDDLQAQLDKFTQVNVVNYLESNCFTPHTNGTPGSSTRVENVLPEPVIASPYIGDVNPVQSRTPRTPATPRTPLAVAENENDSLLPPPPVPPKMLTNQNPLPSNSSWMPNASSKKSPPDHSSNKSSVSKVEAYKRAYKVVSNNQQHHANGAKPAISTTAVQKQGPSHKSQQKKPLLDNSRPPASIVQPNRGPPVDTKFDSYERKMESRMQEKKTNGIEQPNGQSNQRFNGYNGPVASGSHKQSGNPYNGIPSKASFDFGDEWGQTKDPRKSINDPVYPTPHSRKSITEQKRSFWE